MERIKDWKSYQYTLNRHKRKNPNILKPLLIFIFAVIFLVISIGGIKLFSYLKNYYTKSVLNKRQSFSGTGIRPIKFTNSKKNNTIETLSASLSANMPGKKYFNNHNFSIKSLQKYFKSYPPKFNTIKNGHYIQKIGKYTIIYTLNPAVQNEAKKVLTTNNVPFGAVAAVNPETGAVLGLYSYASNKSKKYEISDLIAYKLGSLAKVVTASAAIESKGFYPGFNVCYNGGLYGTNKNYWIQNINTGNNKISFSLAFAKSCDIAFGKIAGFYVGRTLMQKYFDKYYFNHKIPFILNLQNSTAKVPSKFYNLELTGAGFKGARVTPILAALMSAAVINGGKLLDPYIIKEIISSSGRIVYKHKGVRILDYPITLSTAAILKKLMIDTVTKGVGRYDFYNNYNQYMLQGVTTGGKTGTISGNHPTGLYQWFTGFGETKNRKIAVSALVVEKPVWRIAGGGVSEKIIYSYFFNNNYGNNHGAIKLAKK
ncbi:MAG: penicillin-binding transpeptidase domain-containing protein [bacterium]